MSREGMKVREGKLTITLWCKLDTPRHEFQTRIPPLNRFIHLPQIVNIIQTTGHPDNDTEFMNIHREDFFWDGDNGRFSRLLGIPYSEGFIPGS